MMNKEHFGQTVLFREEQQFRQGFLWALLAVTAILIVSVFAYGMVRQLVMGSPWGTRPLPDVALAVVGTAFISLITGLTCLFYFLRLTIEVRSDGLYIRFFPFHLSFRKIPFSELKTYEVRTYRPIIEYGGWGIRYGWKGMAYNVSGNRGVQLEFINGKRLLLGSQMPERLYDAIASGAAMQKRQDAASDRT